MNDRSTTSHADRAPVPDAPTGTAEPGSDRSSTSATVTAPPPETVLTPRGVIRESLILAQRSLTKTRRNPGEQMDALIMPIMFLVMFVYLFGGAVADSRDEYVQYLFPGILVMTTILAGLLATGLHINIDIKKGVFDRFRSLPIARGAPLIGSVLGDMIRYVIAVVTVFAVAYLMGFRVETDLASALGAVLLCVALGFSLSWLSVFIGVAVKDENVVTTVAFLGIFPLTFGTDMVAPKETLPGWLQAWTDINPVSHAMDATRGLLLDNPAAGSAASTAASTAANSVAESVTATLLWSAGFLVAFGALAMYAYRRRA
ncbi:ABC transporter permease [Phytoactinopolyspora halotolerans]|uniref:Transport permease protein n=1 Tax=Phytoactinopolyspora halotolerans TaxID=1981512 RepID=A0A6L9SA89_9ACTN|nr:ABC transporter permease [Phytoactinopolyspora halotolerans]NEE02166.1 ABC transporter permease [Phytoactinopolyspora halotolerans]